jgi:uncharacterized Fe-S cluster protein YjdI
VSEPDPSTVPAFHRDSPTRKAYVGEHSIVSFDSALCRHAAECVRGAPAVFDTARRPWIDPDAADADLIETVVGRCPSGALRFSRAA